MTRLDIDLVSLLGDRYDIQMTEYFTLTEEERTYLAKYVVSKIFLTLRQNPEYARMYEFTLQDRIDELTFNEEYEHADLYQRILNEIILTYT
jgi:hypothetical protein